MKFKFSPMTIVLTGILISMQASADPTPAPSASAAPVSQTAAPVMAKPTVASTTPSTVNPSTISINSAPATPVTLAVVTPAAKAPTFTSDQEARIGEVAKEYLLNHPEVLIEVSQKLQAQQQEMRRQAMATAVLNHQDSLLNDKTTPAFGPADAKVAVIEFFDYQCSVCAQQAPVLKALMNEKPQVRYIFKEWPIFGNRWQSSMDAAEIGLQIWQQKGADAYLAYHNAIFATGHNEGKLTPKDIKSAAASAGKLTRNKETTLETLAQTDALAQNLGLRGTPGIIIMPIVGATAGNTTVIPGGASLEDLEAAMTKAETN